MIYVSNVYILKNKNTLHQCVETNNCLSNTPTQVLHHCLSTELGYSQIKFNIKKHHPGFSDHTGTCFAALIVPMEGESPGTAASLNTGKPSVNSLLGTSENSDMQLRKQNPGLWKHGTGNFTGLICLSINPLSANLHGKSINKNEINIQNNMQLTAKKKSPNVWAFPSCKNWAT